MKIYTIAFTKNGANLQSKINILLYNNFCSEVEIVDALSTRVYDEIFGDNPSKIMRKSLSEFTNLAWQNADAIIFVGATGIAVRGIAGYVDKKDKDPAVIVIDEKGNFVIPLLSGHIGGANDLSQIIAYELKSALVITTATDINDKLSIDSWAIRNGYEIADTKGIVGISSAILEDKEVVLIASEKEIDLLSPRYEKFIPYKISKGDFVCQSEEISNIAEKHKDNPVLVISPYNIELKRDFLHIIPKVFSVGMGSVRGKDKFEFAEFYEQTLEQEGIHKKSVISIASIDLKSDEQAFLYLYEKESKNTKLNLEFYKSEELAQAENYTDEKLSVSNIVTSVTGVSNVCERSAIVSGVKNFLESDTSLKIDKKIELVLPKTKGEKMTIAIAKVED